MDTILGYDLFFWIKVFTTVFTAILFVQSSLDKVLHYRDNLAYFESHFKATPLAPLTFLLLPVITLLESLAGWLSAVGLILLLLEAEERVAIWGHLAAVLSIISLFLGQRIAKDYAGAASLVPYFLYLLFALYIFS